MEFKIVEDQAIEDSQENMQKLSRCALEISEFIKTLDESQVKLFFDLELIISDYYSSREEMIIKSLL